MARSITTPPTFWILLLVVHTTFSYGQYPHNTTQEELDILKNELVDLKSEVNELKRNVYGNSNTTSNQTTNSRCPLEITSASRTENFDYSVQFSVTFRQTPNTGNVTVVWRYLTGEVTRINETNITVASVTTKGFEGNVEFYAVTSECMLHLYLVKGRGNTTDIDIKTPILKTEPQGELVYQTGHNLTVLVTSPRTTHERRDPGSYIPTETISSTCIFIRVNETSNILQNKLSYSSLTNVTQTKKYFDKTVSQILFKTAVLGVSGVCLLVSGQNKQTGLVARFEYAEHVILRPSTQHGPFPSDKLYTREAMTMSKADHDFSRDLITKSCSYGEECYVTCEMMGNDISGMSLYMKTNQSMIPVEADTKSVARYLMVKSLVFTPQVGVNMSPVIFSCVASSNTNGKTKTRTVNINVVLVRRLEILRNESKMVRFHNGSVSFTCSAQGIGLNVSANCEAYYSGLFTPGNQTIKHYPMMSGSKVTLKAVCDSMMEWETPVCSASDYYGHNEYFNPENGTTTQPWRFDYS